MIWGKPLWTSIHMIALGFPDHATDTVRQKYKQVFESLGQTLPCPTCQINFERHIRELPIEPFLYDRKSLFAWTVKMHNLVNVELGRKEWTVEDAWTYYREGKFASDHVLGTKYMNLTLFIICVILLLIALIIFMVWWLPLIRRSLSLSLSQKSK